MTAELVAKRHIFKVTCGTAVSGVPIYTPVAQTQCFENPALRGGRRRNSSERACKGKNMNLDIDITLKLILDFFHQKHFTHSSMGGEVLCCCKDCFLFVGSSVAS